MTDQDDFKKRIQASVEKFSKKEDPSRTHRKNNAPERELQQQILKHLNSIGWSVANVDSKSNYSVSQGRYIAQSAQVGTSDIVGNDPHGRSVYIEVKAPGKRKTIRSKQYDFLIQKINTNCFAIVADSKDYIMATYGTWLIHPHRQEYLTKELPIPKPQDTSETLF